ncbi:MerR family transcriptional regulator [Actinoallomurus sp. NPDC052274]|uniref:MerR family transcriptional regulator n=1 Tax=Actinoallomurus sp. NPDC052274 TaxID=3155420 RepID=UPI00342B5EB2
MSVFRIDELAHAAGSTVRNIRAYQDRGLLPPPRLQGRVGLYDESHLARLRLIGQLLGRGYTLATIAELISAWERGRNLSDLLGLEKVLTDPWSDEIPGHLDAAELVKLFAVDPESEDAPALLRLAEEHGFLEAEGDDRYKVPSPRLLHVGTELVAAGIPLPAVFEIAGRIREDCAVIARRFVDLARVHGDLSAERLVSGEQIAEAATFVQRLRPLAQLAVEGLLARCMEAEVRAALGDELAAAVARDTRRTPEAAEGDEG